MIVQPRCASCYESMPPMQGSWRMLNGLVYHNTGSCEVTYQNRQAVQVRLALFYAAYLRRN